MKTILVDAVDAFIIKTDKGYDIFADMQKMLDGFTNRKIIVTGAFIKDGFPKYGLDAMPYEVFTLEHNPEKTDPEYYRIMLRTFGLRPEEVVYFEHNPEAVTAAQSVGIATYFWDNDKRPLEDLRLFLNKNII